MENKHDDIEAADRQTSPTDVNEKPLPAHEHVGTLGRKLKSRHIQFLALSGAIGTGYHRSARPSTTPTNPSQPLRRLRPSPLPRRPPLRPPRLRDYRL